MRVLDVLKGTGTGVAEDVRRSVRYELSIFDPPSDGESTGQIQGWVLPTFGVLGETVTLEMQDGGHVVFEFLSNDGVVSVKDIVPCPRKV
jgi:hypothetical protein